MENNQLEKKFGLPTALAMVVGIVIGSGVFVKAVKVLSNTGGDMGKSLLVIGIVGIICIVCSCVFALLGTKYVKCNGVVDYAEVACGPWFGYNMGWFMTTMYYPILAATLAFISANYCCMLFNWPIYGQACTALAAFFLFAGIAINSLAPKLAGKMQVSMTVIKLIPLVLMGVIGAIVGLVNGNGVAIFTDTSIASSSGGGMLGAICAFAFSYEGWIIATTINSELKNPKRDLPLALIVGAVFCTIIYMLYTYSMSATMTAAEIVACGDWLPKIAFSNLFGNTVGTLVMVIIVISCLGTTNGLIMGSMRGFYSLAVRGQGIMPERISEVDKTTDMPLKSCFAAMFVIGFWFFQATALFFNGPLLEPVTGNLTHNPIWFMAWEGDEIVIITQYAMYIPIFLYLIFKEKEFNFFQRFVLPILGLAACVFLCYCCWTAYEVHVFYYLVVFVIFMGVGNIFYKKSKKSAA